MNRRSGIKEALNKKVHPVILFLIFLLIILTTVVGMRTYESKITSIYDNINQSSETSVLQPKPEIDTDTKEGDQSDDQSTKVATEGYGNTQASSQSSMKPATSRQQPAPPEKQPPSQSTPPPEQPTPEPFICLLGVCL